VTDDLTDDWRPAPRRRREREALDDRDARDREARDRADRGHDHDGSSNRGPDDGGSVAPGYVPGSSHLGTPLAGRAPVRELVARDLAYVRGGRQILADVSLTAWAGEVLAVTGPSGSGKSSLLALLAGLDHPDSGQVLVDGQPLGSGVPDGFGLVLQGYGLVSVLTAAENVEVVLQGRGLARAEVRDRAEAALAAVGLADVEDHLVEQLSGGQQQRVAVARALVMEPTVLLADEFTAELDHESSHRILALVLAVAQRGGLVVIATHDRAVAEACDHELRLVDGRLA
jgi:heme ABC exporter ATP-binding subunit CcmA